MTRVLWWLAVLFFAVLQPDPVRPAPAPEAADAPPLKIYFIDVEGGAATLIVTPAGESILVDCGWPREDKRDARRIVERVRDRAGLDRIDYFVVSHYHRDHFGGIADLASLIPIGTFVDYGENREEPRNQAAADLNETYKRLSTGKRLTLRPGDMLPLKLVEGAPRLKMICAAAGGEIMPVTGGPQASSVAAECAAHTPKRNDPSDNARSIVLWLQYGDFEFLNCGDLTWNVEHQLMCPTNILGRVDLWQVPHHGLNSSSNPVFVRAIRPTVAVACNGMAKGVHPDVMQTVRSTPSIRDLYQLHYNFDNGPDGNTREALIANLEREDDCPGRGVTVTVDPTRGTFTVHVERGDVHHSYAIR